MDKIRRGLRKVRAKLERAATGLAVADQRVRHHKKREHHFAAKRDGAHDETWKGRFEAKRKRAHDEKRKWQKRQTKLARRHKYLQLVFDRRMRKKAKWLDAHPQKAPTSGVVTFDGKPVAAWIVHDILQPARDQGYWNGYVISGWRDPVYSEQLCYNICGAPSCSGLCAGRTSNHSGDDKPAGATDLTDPQGTIDYARDHGIEWHGNGEMLPSDKPHCSASGV